MLSGPAWQTSECPLLDTVEFVPGLHKTEKFCLKLEMDENTWIFNRFVLWLLEDDVKAAGNAELGESADVEAVQRVELEEDKVAVAGWEDDLAV